MDVGCRILPLLPAADKDADMPRHGGRPQGATSCAWWVEGRAYSATTLAHQHASTPHR